MSSPRPTGTPVTPTSCGNSWMSRPGECGTRRTSSARLTGRLTARGSNRLHGEPAQPPDRGDRDDWPTVLTNPQAAATTTAATATGRGATGGRFFGGRAAAGGVSGGGFFGGGVLGRRRGDR